MPERTQEGGRPNLPPRLGEKLALLPPKPGVYLLKNAAGEVIYIGKARSLRNRVRQYFQEGHGHTPKVRAMVEKVHDLEFIITGTEIEALILEANLVKEHAPWYNIRLKDDKHYPYLRISVQETWPRLAIVRRIKRDGARYFGPYADVGALRETLNLLRKIFPIRTCRKEILPEGGKDRPCLNYHIHRCLAPCAGLVSAETYQEAVAKACAVLEGQARPILAELQTAMERAAEDLEYEKAARYRDQIRALERVCARQRVSLPGSEEEDVVAVAMNELQDLACAQVFQVRGGQIVDREHFLLEEVAGSELTEVVGAFLEQYYASAPAIPPVILVPVSLPEVELLEAWLTQRRGGPVRILHPRRGEKRQLLDLAVHNAELMLGEELTRLAWEEGKTHGAVAELQGWLALPELPNRIEAYDISNLQGAEAVGSMVVFEGGRPKKSDYRRFRIRGVVGPNDFAMLQEVIRRRFTTTQPGFDRRPDLVVIDGGKGQLNAVREVMRDLAVDYIPAIGLAKENEWVFVEGRSEPVILPRDSQALFLLQRIRDEAHRFAVSYHRQLHGKEGLRSILDEIPGIGPKRKAALVKAFGSLEKMHQASLEELKQVPGITSALAEKIKEFLEEIKS